MNSLARACLTMLATAMVGATGSMAFACGFCIEDKIAAVYDYAVVTRAFSQKHQVVFFAVEGKMAAGDEARRKVQALVESVVGIDRGSARLSAEPSALSAAFNPARTPFAAMERSLTRKLAAYGLSIAVLRIMDAPLELKQVER
jgi:hypothetical protein